MQNIFGLIKLFILTITMICIDGWSVPVISRSMGDFKFLIKPRF